MFDENKAIEFLATILFALFVLLAMDYFEQQTAIENIIERIKYREMVCSGAWQDYKELKPECLKKGQE